MLSSKVTKTDQMQKLNELNTLQNLRPCLDSDLMVGVEGRVQNSELHNDTRHPFIIPSRHGITRLITFYKTWQAVHASPLYIDADSITILDYF